MVQHRIQEVFLQNCKGFRNTVSCWRASRFLSDRRGLAPGTPADQVIGGLRIAALYIGTCCNGRDDTLTVIRRQHTAARDQQV
ncbi:hypothetical protein GDO81_025342 [Engystomops pustulosus]|uniref:Uncharacterized protein n=1 Tax=Engystomops pustulosus TaxID=76066 RepID=A0AAV6YJ16_ENGPU|nr:hypothetical protein GDO81_025342 [Engystomops pustulosus]